MKTSRSWLPIALFALGALAISIRPATASDGASRVVGDLSTAVVAVLRQKDTSIDVKRREIRGIVETYVDFETMSRLVLAWHWSTLTDSEKSEFVEQFKRFIGATYGNSVESYRNESVEICGERDEGRGDWTVQTKIVRPDGASPILLDYRLRMIGGKWRVIDLLVERVSLVSSFRSQFQEIFANGGIVRLLDVLREKNGAVTQAKSS